MRLSSKRRYFYNFNTTILPLHPLPPTSHGQLTLPLPCLTNSLPLFIQLCSHGDRAESPQTAWLCGLRGPSWPSKCLWFPKKKNIGTCYSFNVLRMKAYNAVKQYQELFEISFCFWLLSGDQYYGPLCCERKSKESPSCLWFTQWAIAKLFASKCG